jgi:hypothetical protein
MTNQMNWRISELLSSGYTSHEVARILDIPFQWVVFVETEGVTE